jgi:hypothetical protein
MYYLIRLLIEYLPFSSLIINSYVHRDVCPSMRTFISDFFVLIVPCVLSGPPVGYHKKGPRTTANVETEELIDGFEPFYRQFSE